MQFGYHIQNTYEPELDGSASALYGRYLEQAEAAEAAGFDAIWATEHHFRYFGGMTPSPQLLLTAISQRTRRPRDGAVRLPWLQLRLGGRPGTNERGADSDRRGLDQPPHHVRRQVLPLR